MSPEAPEEQHATEPTVERTLRAGPDDDSQDALLSTGNRLRWRSLAPLLVAAAACILTMASPLSARWGVPLGLLTSLLAVFGVLDVLGSFDDAGQDTPYFSSITQLLTPLSFLLVSVLALWLLLRAAVAGWLPWWAASITITIAFIAVIIAVFHCGQRLGAWRVDEQGQARPLHRRHGFWLMATTTLLYLPMLGNHSLIDPWEPHYGEVAREILARNDWISLWWAQDGWFWSKPILSFWMQAGSMSLLGVHYEPGELLSNVALGATPRPEWALRMPIFLLTLLGVYFLYKAIAKSHGRRAGLLGGVVLVSMPQFFLVAHQSMTDMPFVACMAATMGLFWYAVQLDPEEQVTRYAVRFGRRTLKLSLFHLVIGAVLLLALPQVFYLVSRNVSFTGKAFSFVSDSFASGSPGNCGLPSNAACKPNLQPLSVGLQPAAQAVNWLLALALLLWLSWGERRRQRLVFLAAWFFIAIATMAKGVAGLGLPVLAALAFVVATRRYRDLTRMEIGGGLLIFVVTVMPWFVAMFARHGLPFVERLLVHDMFKRAFRHVHDTNKGDDTSFRYYVWQLGYATFPWVGLVPLALTQWLADDDKAAAAQRRRAGSLLLAGWFLLGFVLFSVMGTKFHHYCLPLVPPLAMLVGIALDRLWRSSKHTDASARLMAASCVGSALLTLLVGRDLFSSMPERADQVRLMRLFTYNYKRHWPESLDFRTTLLFFTVVSVVCIAGIVVHRSRRAAIVALAGSALAFAAWGVNSYMVQASAHWGQRDIHLRYEAERVEIPGTLVAYQMNWKGENFYRGNHVPVFVSSGKKFTKWIAEQKEKGVRTLYFATEHHRSDNLSRELGKTELFEPLTDRVLNNKFQLIRVRFLP